MKVVCVAYAETPKNKNELFCSLSEANIFFILNCIDNCTTKLIILLLYALYMFYQLNILSHQLAFD